MAKKAKKYGSTKMKFRDPKILLRFQQLQKLTHNAPKRGTRREEFDLQLKYNNKFPGNQRYNFATILDNSLNGDYEVGLESIIYP